MDSVEHLVLFKLKDTATEEEVNALAKGLLSLTSVPGVKAISAGRNFTDRGKGFTFGLRVTLESKEALEVYRVHPDHLRVIKDYVTPAATLTETVSVDYTCKI